MAAQTNFIDIATIWLHAGKGGDGAVSFHREKFVAAGGPDGGDGGRGGDIIFVADDHLTTLMDFRYKRKYVAPEGGKGGASLCHGKNAENLVIKVPLGTVIKDAESGLVIADLSDHTPVTIAKGGRGGYGNAHFATPTRQIPKFAKPGMPGEDHSGDAGAEADRRCGPDRLPQCGQVHPHLHHQRGQAQDRKLPLHHPCAHAGRCVGGRRAQALSAPTFPA